MLNREEKKNKFLKVPHIIGFLKYVPKCSVVFYGKKVILARQFVLDSWNCIKKIQIENNSKSKAKYYFFMLNKMF